MRGQSTPEAPTTSDLYNNSDFFRSQHNYVSRNVSSNVSPSASVPQNVKLPSIFPVFSVSTHFVRNQTRNKFILSITPLNNSLLVRNLANTLIACTILNKDVQIDGIFLKKSKVMKKKMCATLGLKSCPDKSQYQNIEISFTNNILEFSTTENNKFAGIRTNLFLLRIIISILEQECQKLGNLSLVKDHHSDGCCDKQDSGPAISCFICGAPRHRMCVQGDVSVCKRICSNFSLNISSVERLDMREISNKFNESFNNIFTKGQLQNHITNLKNFQAQCPPAPPSPPPAGLHTIDHRDPIVTYQSEEIRKILNDNHKDKVRETQLLLEVTSKIRSGENIFCYKHGRPGEARKRLSSDPTTVKKLKKRKCSLGDADAITYADIHLTIQADTSSPSSTLLIPLSLAASRPPPSHSHRPPTRRQQGLNIQDTINDLLNDPQYTTNAGDKSQNINKMNKGIFDQHLSEKEIKSVSKNNFYKLSHGDLKQDWTWLNNKKKQQPPTRDSQGKIKIATNVNELTQEDIETMSQAQLLNSWRLSTGIYESKLELLRERLKVSDSLIHKYQTDMLLIDNRPGSLK